MEVIRSREADPLATLYDAHLRALAALDPDFYSRASNLKPAGDDAIIQEIAEAQGVDRVSDAEIALSWGVQTLDPAIASAQRSEWIEEGRTTSEDVARVFFTLASEGYM